MILIRTYFDLLSRTLCVNLEALKLYLNVLQEIPLIGTFDSDNGDALRVAALSGLGIIHVLSFQVEADVCSKRLNLLYTDMLTPGPVVQAIFTHQRNLSLRVRVLLEFLAAQSAGVLR